MSFIKTLREALSVPREYRQEFLHSGAGYNYRGALALSAITPVSAGGAALLIEFSTFGKLAGSLLPCAAGVIVFSLVSAGLLILLRKKPPVSLTNAVTAALVVVLMAFFQIASHMESAVTGVKNINIILLIMFGPAFFLRFRLSVTIGMEALFTVGSVFLLTAEKEIISNYHSSLLALLAAGVTASIAACIYWKLRLDRFIQMKELEAIATTDPLTQIPNRRGFEISFSQAWDQAYGEDAPLTILMIDIDHFKNYNDTYGHIAGDKCLAQVAQIIAGSVRKQDFVARYGGEEFAVILTRADERSAAGIARRMLWNMRERKTALSPVPFVTFSIGCMTCRPRTAGITRRVSLQLADNALYMAKNQGRNRFVFHPAAGT